LQTEALCQWAIEDANNLAESKGKDEVSESGAAKGAADANDDFIAAIGAIMTLPLNRSEKAEAVRRLLRGNSGGRASDGCD
jgi:hypothetical protein